ERSLTDNPGPDFCPRPSPDGRSIAFLAGRRCGPHRDHHVLSVLDRETGAVRELTGENDPVPDVLAAQCWSADSASIYFSGWRGREERDDVLAATSFNAWLAEYDLGEVEVVTWESDGLTIEGVRVMPPGYEPGKRYPALLFSHGGPHSRVTCGLHLEWFWQF